MYMVAVTVDIHRRHWCFNVLRYVDIATSLCCLEGIFWCLTGNELLQSNYTFLSSLKHPWRMCFTRPHTLTLVAVEPINQC